MPLAAVARSTATSWGPWRRKQATPLAMPTNTPDATTGFAASGRSRRRTTDGLRALSSTRRLPWSRPSRGLLAWPHATAGAAISTKTTADTMIEQTRMRGIIPHRPTGIHAYSSGALSHGSRGRF